ncbi:MAG: hypothetical protein AABX83_02575 [Nanoarchaeota archaeon]
MYKIDEDVDSIRKSLDSRNIRYDYSRKSSGNVHQFSFEDAGLEATLKIDGNSLYLEPVADLWGESRYELQDAILDLMLKPLKERYAEDHTHMTNALVRDEENSEEGQIVFIPGHDKIMDEKDIPYPYLKAYRVINQMAVAAKYRVGLGKVIRNFEPANSSEKVDRAYHHFKLDKPVAA